MHVNNKFITPLVTIAILVVGFIQVANSDNDFTTLEKVQLLALIVGAVVTYFAPLTKGRWPGIFKVGGAVIGAALAVIITALMEGTVIDSNLLIVVILAALNAFAAQTGTDARIDAQKEVLVNPDLPTRAGAAIDPIAAKVAHQELDKAAGPGRLI